MWGGISEFLVAVNVGFGSGVAGKSELEPRLREIKAIKIRAKYRAINLCHARKEIIVNFIPGIENPADLFTKALFGHKWKYIAHKFMHDPLESDYML